MRMSVTYVPVIEEGLRMAQTHHIPEISYGVLRQNSAGSQVDEVVEQVKSLGYAVLDAGYSTSELGAISEEFNTTRMRYVETHGEVALRRANEFHTIRSPLTHGGDVFLRLVFNANLLDALSKLIAGQFILNQQNGVINPPRETYSQASWHRDLPYQHFLSTTPLAINALFCVDDFTVENGATFVLPASHKTEAFPSAGYVRRNAVQVEAKAGSFILLDCMMFHAGGFNTTGVERRAVNHLFNIPFFKQQIAIRDQMERHNLSLEERQILDFNSPDGHESIESYLKLRLTRFQAAE